jgi:hypothetical protein
VAVNSTDYSELEDAVYDTLSAALNISNSGYIPDADIKIHDGDISLAQESFSEWAKGRHGPKVVIAIEGIDDEEFTEEGGRHPRKTWQTVTVALYLYDESLRYTRSESRRGHSSKTNAPGIYKLINDVRATLTGYVAAVHTLGWEGPFWQNANLKEKSQGQQLWRMECQYRGCVENTIDTSALDNLDEFNGDFNVSGSTRDPDVEALTSL